MDQQQLRRARRRRRGDRRPHRARRSATTSTWPPRCGSASSALGGPDREIPVTTSRSRCSSRSNGRRCFRRLDRRRGRRAPRRDAERARSTWRVDRPQQRSRRVVRRVARSATTRRCSTSSPAPTSPAASTPATRRRCGACATSAVDNGVAIGAQVGYPDLAGFGRRFIDIEPDELRDVVLYQLGALDAFAQVAGTGVAYVKPHGALYNAMHQPPAQAEAVAAAAARVRPVAAGARRCPARALLRAARTRPGWTPVVRGVRRPGLPGRRHAGAARRARRGADRPGDGRGAGRGDRHRAQRDGGRRHGREGRRRSICIHGDTPGAVALARAVRDALDDAGVGVHRFTDVSRAVLPMGPHAVLIERPRRTTPSTGPPALRRVSIAPGVAEVVPAARDRARALHRRRRAGAGRRERLASVRAVDPARPRRRRRS